MLQLTPRDQQYALKQADDARENARAAKDDADRHFWTRMELRWHGIADTSSFITRLNKIRE